MTTSEDQIIQVRQEKHAKLNGETYPLPCNSPMPIDKVIESFDLINPIPMSLDINELSTNPDGQVYLCGRIVNNRKSGGITFLKLEDSTATIQVIATKASLEDYVDLTLLDLGDIVEIHGWPCLSKTGERSILITEWNVLTKSRRPIPLNFNGISDQETKYRQRYLDLASNEESRARFVARTYIIRAIREFFECRSFLEVETPTLTSVASGANAKPFRTHHNALDMDLSLRIAPELYLKRLLVGGFDRVFEIGRNYRNEGISTRHNPEFTMMECYQAYGKFDELISLTKTLIQGIDFYLVSNLSPAILKYYDQWSEQRSFSLFDFQQVTMEQAVKNGLYTVGFESDKDFSEISSCALVSSNRFVNQITINKSLTEIKTRGERIAFLFEHVAEPYLVEDYRSPDGSKSSPLFITEYPKEISPLARANDLNPSITDRFELFIEGKEIANGFQELNDPKEQALRFKEQLASNEKDPMLMDEDYIQALEYGMPPAVGMGCGIDRICCAFTNAQSIRDVILFPTLRPKG